MRFTDMKDRITIVIPSKNEGEGLWECVRLISQQRDIKGTNVIIADCSDSPESLEWIRKIQIDFKPHLDIEIIPGGFPASARLSGSRLVTTTYLLFLDADIMLTDSDTLHQALSHEKDLVTLTMETERGWNWVYRGFDLFQWLGIKLGTSFAIGGFQLWNTKAYWETGGYDPLDLFAEDYAISRKVPVKKFCIIRSPRVWTSARRFKQKGVLWMFSIMLRSYLNRNNPKFFRHHHNYWG